MSPPCCLVGDKLRLILIAILCDTVEYTVLLDLQCLTKELCGLCRVRNLVALCERNQRLLNLITHAYIDACFCCCHNKVSVSKVCHLSTVGQFTGVSQNATGVSPSMNGRNNKCVRRHTPLPEKQPRCRPRNAPPFWAGIDGRHVLLRPPKLLLLLVPKIAVGVAHFVHHALGVPFVRRNARGV